MCGAWRPWGMRQDIHLRKRYILWMGQRNPNHQLKTVVNIPLFIGFQPSKVVQDFATTHRSYGKITIWIGKSTVNGKLSIAMWVYWRVTQEKISQITVVMINISDGYLEAYYLRWTWFSNAYWTTISSGAIKSKRSGWWLTYPLKNMEVNSKVNVVQI